MAKQTQAGGGITNDIPVASQTALVATTEEALIPTSFTTISPAEAYPGKIWRLTAGGIMSWAGTGTLILTPRVGLVIGGITLGASVVALTTPGATTAHAWMMIFHLICRTVAAGANSTLIGTGMFWSSGVGSAGTSTGQSMGGTSATADVTTAQTGIWVGKTISVAGSITTQYCVMEALN